MADASSSLPFASDGSFFEQFQRLQEKQLQEQQQQQQQQQQQFEEAAVDISAAAAPSEPPPAQPQQGLANSDFIASTSFTGARPGFLFKTDAQGTGYYQDVGLQGWLQKRQEVAKAKPTVIKANKNIAKIAPRGGEPSSKKAKTDAADGRPKYIREMEKYKQLSCSGDTKHDRPLVK